MFNFFFFFFFFFLFVFFFFFLIFFFVLFVCSIAGYSERSGLYYLPLVHEKYTHKEFGCHHQTFRDGYERFGGVTMSILLK